jgi:large subunit ribosomal protein L21
MKQAVIETGGKQYIVAKNQELDVELVDNRKQISFRPLLVWDENSTRVGAPYVDNAKVTAQVVEPERKGDKVIAIRYKPKKRVHTRRGHRQRFSRIRITGITYSGAQQSRKSSASQKSKTKAAN